MLFRSVNVANGRQWLFSTVLNAWVPGWNNDNPKAVTAAVASAAAAITPSGPLFHVTGCNCVLHPATAVGGRVVLMYRWDPDLAVELIEREKVTVFTGVPTMSREMIQSPRWAETDTSSLAAMGGGGGRAKRSIAVSPIASSMPWLAYQRSRKAMSSGAASAVMPGRSRQSLEEGAEDRSESTRLNSSHMSESRMPSSA